MEHPDDEIQKCFFGPESEAQKLVQTRMFEHNGFKTSKYTLVMIILRIYPDHYITKVKCRLQQFLSTIKELICKPQNSATVVYSLVCTK